MTILHVIENLNIYGGTPRKLYNLAKNDSTNMHLFFMFNVQEDFKNDFSNGIRIFISRSSLINTINLLIHIIKHHNIDLICSHFLRAKVIGTIAAVITSRKIYHFEHGLPRISYNKFSIKNILGLIIENIFSLFVTKYICNSYTVRYTLIREVLLSRFKVYVIDNAINPITELNLDILSKIKNEYAIDNDEFKILISGGFVPARDFITIIDAIQMFSAKFSDVKIFLIGNGPDLSKIEARLKRYNFQNIYFLGYQIHLQYFMSIADVFIYPIIKTSGIGLTLLEAMYHQSCVISFAKGDNRDNPIINKVNGILVQRNASDINKALNYLYSNRLEMKRIAYNGRLTVEKYFIFSNYVKHFNELLD